MDKEFKTEMESGASHMAASLAYAKSPAGLSLPCTLGNMKFYHSTVMLGFSVLRVMRVHNLGFRAYHFGLREFRVWVCRGGSIISSEPSYTYMYAYICMHI